MDGERSELPVGSELMPSHEGNELKQTSREKFPEIDRRTTERDKERKAMWKTTESGDMQRASILLRADLLFV